MAKREQKASLPRIICALQSSSNEFRMDMASANDLLPSSESSAWYASSMSHSARMRLDTASPSLAESSAQ